MLIHRLAPMAVAMAVPALANGADFVDGDVYLLTHDYPGMGKAIVHIDPVAGTHTGIYDINSAEIDFRLTYDPYRDRLVIRPFDQPDGFVLIDHLGNETSLPFTWENVDLWAPDGEGRIFMIDRLTDKVGYVDANGAPHDLLDVDGITPFLFSYFPTNREDLIFDHTTNSLFVTEFEAPGTRVSRIPLSADRTQVTGPPVAVNYDGFPTGSDEPFGLSAGPNGSLFVKLDTNSNAPGVRMFTMDPVTMVGADFANLDHLFVAGNNAGTYNSVHGIAFSLDTANNQIRTFVQSGAEQEGTVLSTGVSGGGGSGEVARMITIGDTIIGFVDPGCDADGDNSGAVDATDLLGLLAAWGTADPTYDIAPAGSPDGVVNLQDLLLLLSQWGPC